MSASAPRSPRVMMEQAFDWLDAPVARVAGVDVPMPYAANLERLALPQADRHRRRGQGRLLPLTPDAGGGGTMPIKILMPALSPTMTEGNLAKWHVKEGDEVASGDVIAEIETDKATMEVEAVDEGTVGKIVVAEGTEGVAVNDMIAVLLEEGEDAAVDVALAGGAASAPAPRRRRRRAAPPKRAASSGAATPQAAPGCRAQDLPRSPGARRRPRRRPAGLARRFASPLAPPHGQAGRTRPPRIEGSGPHGRIVKADIEAAPRRPAPGGLHLAAHRGGTAPPQRPTPRRHRGAARSPTNAWTWPTRTGAAHEHAQGHRARLTEAKQTGPAFLSDHRLRDRRAAGAMRKQLNGRGCRTTSCLGQRLRHPRRGLGAEAGAGGQRLLDRRAPC